MCSHPGRLHRCWYSLGIQPNYFWLEGLLSLAARTRFFLMKLEIIVVSNVTRVATVGSPANKIRRSVRPLIPCSAITMTPIPRVPAKTTTNNTLLTMTTKRRVQSQSLTTL